MTLNDSQGAVANLTHFIIGYHGNIVCSVCPSIYKNVFPLEKLGLLTCIKSRDDNELIFDTLCF